METAFGAVFFVFRSMQKAPSHSESMSRRDCLDSPMRSSRRRPVISAANHRYGLVFAVTPGHRHALRNAGRRTSGRCKRRLRRSGDRRTTMRPVPGNVVSASEGRAIDIDVESAKWSRAQPAVGPNVDAAIRSDVDSAVRSPRTNRQHRPRRTGESMVGGGQKRHADRHDERRTYFPHHGTHTNSCLLVGIVGRAPGTRQRIINQ